MKNFLILFLLVLITSCKQKPPTTTALYEKYKSSVVIIENYHYFKFVFSDKDEIFFNVIGNEAIIYEDENEAKLNPISSTGTGFFITSSGEIVTNLHVVNKTVNEKPLIDFLNSFLTNLIEEKQKKIDEIETNYTKNYIDLSDFEKYLLKEEYKSLNDDIKEIKNENDLLIEKEYKIEYILNRIEIGFNDTQQEGDNNNFMNAKVVKKSENTDVDIAIIQTEHKITPSHVTNYFSITELNNFNVNPSINDNVFMIGYNKGFLIANTENGLKSQFTQGKITQEPDKKRVLYSIPALPGSSGSPILDEWGNLIAINYAGVTNGQGFNLGIPVNNLLKLYYDDNVPEIISVEHTNGWDNVKFAHKFEEYYKNLDK